MDRPTGGGCLLGLPELAGIGQVALAVGVDSVDPSLGDPAVPPPFLSPKERATYATLRVAKRRADWLRGRLTLKRLAQRVARSNEHADLALEAISVEAAPDGAPTVTVLDPRRRSLELRSVSLSHSAGVAFCALAAGSTVGVDLELVEPRSAAFAEDYFTAAEQAQMAACSPSDRPMVVTALWSAKEAVLKAHRLGLTVDTRALSCRLERARRHGWRRFRWTWDTARAVPSGADAEPRALAGYWRQAGRFVLTVAELGSGP